MGPCPLPPSVPLSLSLSLRSPSSRVPIRPLPSPPPPLQTRIPIIVPRFVPPYLPSSQRLLHETPTASPPLPPRCDRTDVLTLSPDPNPNHPQNTLFSVPRDERTRATTPMPGLSASQARHAHAMHDSPKFRPGSLLCLAFAVSETDNPNSPSLARLSVVLLSPTAHRPRKKCPIWPSDHSGHQSTPKSGESGSRGRSQG